MNSKNLLQEYYQNKNLPLPIYNTLSANEGLWVSTVTITFLGYNKSFESTPKPTKKDAEKKAAKLAYSFIVEEESKEHDLVVKWPMHSFDIYIDVENQPVAATELSKIIARSPPPENIKIYFVVSEYSELFYKISRDTITSSQVRILSTDMKSPHRLTATVSVHVTISLYSANCIILSEDKFYDALKHSIDDYDSDTFTYTLSISKSYDKLCSMIFAK